MSIKKIISAIYAAFVKVEIREFDVWEWESEEERAAFVKYFHFCN